MQIKIRGSQLMAYYDNDIDLYLTPGCNSPYWNDVPIWKDDDCIATCYEVVDKIIDRYDFDIQAIRESDDYYTIEL
jgi:hypothetical protein